jgi:UDP-GlcNAc:undecaprenyl-phosphate GlcNAc-1-phosphate transferase
MLLPGLEMARLFIERIFNKKNPLLADRNHFHHLLLKYFKNENKNFVIFSSSIIYYLMIIIYLNFQRYEIILFYILTYFIFINYLKKKID